MNAKMKIAAIVVALGFLAPHARADKPKTYSIKLSTVVTVGGHELQAGDYRLVVDTHDPKVRFQNTKSGEEVEIEAKLEPSQQKFDSTALHSTRSDAGVRIVEIWLGGTKTRVVFE